jgi:hypothetical protein
MGQRMGLRNKENCRCGGRFPLLEYSEEKTATSCTTPSPRLPEDLARSITPPSARPRHAS